MKHSRHCLTTFLYCHLEVPDKYSADCRIFNFLLEKQRSQWILIFINITIMSRRLNEYKLKTTYALVKQRKLKYFASRNSHESNKDNTVIPNII